MTNEQSVAKAEAKIAKLKEDYVSCLTKIILRHADDNSSPTLEELLKCQRLSLIYFNYVEGFVGQSGLLGAHENGLWVTGFAETCYGLLEVILSNYLFFKKNRAAFHGHLNEPSIHAYSNMQRMVKEYLRKEQYLKLKQDFKENGLPITGFEFKEAPDMSKSGNWQPIVGVVISLVLMFVVMFFAYATPNPSVFQTFIFRGIFALAAALIAAIIPGFLSVETRWKSLKLRATGASAIFVIIWLVNPPMLMQ